MNMILAQHLLDTYLQQLEIDADSAVEIPLSLRLVDAPMGDEPILHIDQALAEGKAEVRELNPPTVSRLEVCNLSEFRVLVPPFALLQGGGQNRTVIKPAVLEPHSSATIEVHCVPMGRWNPRAGGTFARSRSAPMGFKRRSMKHYLLLPDDIHPRRGLKPPTDPAVGGSDDEATNAALVLGQAGGGRHRTGGGEGASSGRA